MELLIYAWLASRSDHLNLQSACELGRGRGQVLEEEALHLWDGPLSPGGVSPTELHRNTPSQCWRIAQWNGNPTHTHTHTLPSELELVPALGLESTSEV